jgi:fermentation-respiration switch protein FrsA (DUF1100 family)
MDLLILILIVLLTFSIIVLAVGFLLSLKLTQRSFLKETSSPAEVGLEFTNVSFSAQDGIQLKGWYIPTGDSDHTVIQLHGHAGSMDPDISYARVFHDAGFNVLMFDFRAHGRSEGKVCTFGYLERGDVLGAIDFAKLQGARWIALVGFSMGGMAAILTAPVTKDVNAVISDGAPVRISTGIRVWGRQHHFPNWLSAALARLALIMASLRIGANLYEYEPVRWVHHIAPTPLMLIHGEADEFCPDFNDLEARAVGAEIWREPGIGHVQIFHQKPKKYTKRIITFLNGNR